MTCDKNILSKHVPYVEGPFNWLKDLLQGEVLSNPKKKVLLVLYNQSKALEDSQADSPNSEPRQFVRWTPSRDSLPVTGVGCLIILKGVGVGGPVEFGRHWTFQPYTISHLWCHDWGVQIADDAHIEWEWTINPTLILNLHNFCLYS